MTWYKKYKKIWDHKNGIMKKIMNNQEENNESISIIDVNIMMNSCCNTFVYTNAFWYALIYSDTFDLIYFDIF